MFLLQNSLSHFLPVGSADLLMGKYKGKNSYDGYMGRPVIIMTSSDGNYMTRINHGRFYEHVPMKIQICKRDHTISWSPTHNKIIFSLQYIQFGVDDGRNGEYRALADVGTGNMINIKDFSFNNVHDGLIGLYEYAAKMISDKKVAADFAIAARIEAQNRDVWVKRLNGPGFTSIFHGVPCEVLACSGETRDDLVLLRVMGREYYHSFIDKQIVDSIYLARFKDFEERWQTTKPVLIRRGLNGWLVGGDYMFADNNFWKINNKRASSTKDFGAAIAKAGKLYPKNQEGLSQHQIMAHYSFTDSLAEKYAGATESSDAFPYLI